MSNSELKSTKQILFPNKQPHRFFAIDFFASLYQGSQLNFRYLASLSDPIQFYDESEIRPKANALAVVQAELQEKPEGSIIGFFQNPDPYNPIEKNQQLMRETLEIIYQKKLGVYIETSSDVIIRDFDLLKKIKSQAQVTIAIPISNSIDLMTEKLEGISASKFSDRIRLLHKCKEAGLLSGVLLKPIVPYMNDATENIMTIIDKAKDAGCDFIYPSFVITMDELQKNRFYELINKDFPGLKNIYMDRYGFKNSWSSPFQQNLKKEFVFACKKNKIKYGMKEIIFEIKPSKNEQFKLF